MMVWTMGRTLVVTNTVIEGVDLSRFQDKIKEAAEVCPVEVIKYE